MPIQELIFNLYRHWERNEIPVVDVVQEDAEAWDRPPDMQAIKAGDEMLIKSRYIKTPVSDFEERLAELTKDNLPTKLSWTVSPESIKALVEQAVRDAFQRTIKELKHTAIRLQRP